MKRLILFIAFMVSVVNANGAKLVEGSLDCINGEKYIAVNEKVATIEFKTDGDDNDEITLRDPMKEAGEDLGSLFKKFLKKK